MPDERLGLLKGLPHRRDVWQGALVRLPMWVDTSDEDPYRPWAGAWMSLSSGRIHIAEPVKPSEKSPNLVVEALLDFALNPGLGGCLPERVEVVNAEIANRLEEALAGFETVVALKERLHGLEIALGHFAEEMNKDNPTPGALAPRGMTVERVASFAEAAKLFFEAAPWQYLTDEDLIRIEEPRVEPDLTHALVMGAGGREFGLMFFASPKLHEALLESNNPGFPGKEVISSVFFGEAADLPIPDSDIFEDHALPVAAQKAYPWAVCTGPGRRVRRLGPKALGQVEAVLRGLAATTETELDGGTWTRLVPTPDGAVRLTLTLPGLSDPVTEQPRTHRRRLDSRAHERVIAEVHRFVHEHEGEPLESLNEQIQELFTMKPPGEILSTASTPLEKAQDLCYQAVEARGRKRVILARKALEMSPDCAEAYSIQAEQSGDPEESLRLYLEGVAAGERALGPARIERGESSFWTDLEARPFMRALQGAGAVCVRLGRLHEAIAHYQRMLKLNPNDNQGVRGPLAGLLLKTGKDVELGTLLDQYAKDLGASLLYARALWIFRREGDNAASRRALRKAFKANPHVPELLLENDEPLPPLSDSYALGSREEAVLCVVELIGSWDQTPEALKWLDGILK